MRACVRLDRRARGGDRDPGAGQQGLKNVSCSFFKDDRQTLKDVWSKLQNRPMYCSGVYENPSLSLCVFSIRRLYAGASRSVILEFRAKASLLLFSSPIDLSVPCLFPFFLPSLLV